MKTHARTELTLCPGPGHVETFQRFASGSSQARPYELPDRPYCTYCDMQYGEWTATADPAAYQSIHPERAPGYDLVRVREDMVPYGPTDSAQPVGIEKRYAAALTSLLTRADLRLKVFCIEREDSGSSSYSDWTIHLHVQVGTDDEWARFIVSLHRCNGQRVELGFPPGGSLVPELFRRTRSTDSHFPRTANQAETGAADWTESTTFELRPRDQNALSERVLLEIAAAALGLKPFPEGLSEDALKNAPWLDPRGDR